MKYPDRLLNITEAAEFLNVKPTWLRDKTVARQVPFTKIGRHVRFTAEHLAEIVAAGEQHIAGAPVRHRRLRSVS